MINKLIRLLPDFFVQVVSFREYLKQSVLRDLRTKYKRSTLGYLWTMLHPLGMMAVLSVVFSHIMNVPAKDYAILLFSAMLPWQYFSSTALMSLHSVRQNARLFGQVPVPKYIFIVSLSLSNLVNYCLALVPLLILMIVLRAPEYTEYGLAHLLPPPTVLAFPILIIPLICVTLGISLILATSNVFFDDTQHLAEVSIQALYFLSPVLYTRDHLPVGLVHWLEFNPLFFQLESLRAIFFNGTLPDPTAFAINAGISLLILLTGLWVFERNEGKFLYFV